ncbi:MAG: GNAT family N-acetyltransferase [Candidatus Kapaibacterium sp.]
MTSLDIRLIAHRSPAYEETVALRDDILRRPLGLSFTPEQLGGEGADYHLACYLDGALAGCLILTPIDDNALKMRQVAVAEEMQGKGVGRALVERSEEIGREKGFREIILNARETAVPFYDRLRYERIGERFEEVGIPHWKMRKSL